MKDILTYMLGVAICGGVFTAFYALALYRRTSFRMARVFLIASVVLSAAIPAFNIPVWKSAPVQISALPADISIYKDLETAGAAAETHQPIDYAQAVVLVVYIMGVVRLLAAIALQFAKIGRIKRRAQVSRADGYRIAVSDDVGPPFSFFTTIYVGSGALPGEMRQILLHESSHIRHRHSVEKIVMELLKALIWFNPFVWIASRQLNEVHEFEADRDVLQGGYSVDEYLPLIFRQVFGDVPEISTGFSNSLIKKRFEMMTKNFKHRRYSWLRTAGVLPAAAAMMMLFSFTHRSPKIIFTEPETNSEQAPVWKYESLEKENRPRFRGESDMNGLLNWLIDETGPIRTNSDEKFEIRFIVMPDGSLDSIEVVSTTNKSLSDQAASIFGRSPKWTPGTVEGKPVPTILTLPVTIRIGESDGSDAKKKSQPAVGKSSSGKAEQIEVVEDKVDAATDEIITVRQFSNKYIVTGTGANQMSLSASASQDSTLKVRINSGRTGKLVFYWLENEKREIEKLDDIAADQIEAISILKNTSEYPQEIIEAMGDREFNGVIVIKSKQGSNL